MNWFGWLKALAPVILRIFDVTRPYADPLQKALDTAEASGAAGPNKKAAVMQTLQYEMVEPTPEKLAAASAVIDHVITVVNVAAKAPA
jgi:hypothetical protein